MCRLGSCHNDAKYHIKAEDFCADGKTQLVAPHETDVLDTKSVGKAYGAGRSQIGQRASRNKSATKQTKSKTNCARDKQKTNIE